MDLVSLLPVIEELGVLRGELGTPSARQAVSAHAEACADCHALLVVQDQWRIGRTAFSERVAAVWFVEDSALASLVR